MANLETEYDKGSSNSLIKIIVSIIIGWIALGIISSIILVFIIPILTVFTVLGIIWFGFKDFGNSSDPIE